MTILHSYEVARDLWAAAVPAGGAPRHASGGNRPPAMPTTVATYRAWPLGRTAGVIEMVMGAVPVTKVKGELPECVASHAGAGTYNPLLARFQAQPVDPGAALRFIVSLLLSTACPQYLFGVSDRHLDNILLTPDLQIVHIDAGHPLGQLTTTEQVDRAGVARLDEMMMSTVEKLLTKAVWDAINGVLEAMGVPDVELVPLVANVTRERDDNQKRFILAAAAVTEYLTQHHAVFTSAAAHLTHIDPERFPAEKVKLHFNRRLLPSDRQRPKRVRIIAQRIADSVGECRAVDAAHSLNMAASQEGGVVNYVANRAASLCACIGSYLPSARSSAAASAA